MPITYTQTDTAADCGAQAACSGGTLGTQTASTTCTEGGTGGSTEQTIEIGAGSTSICHFTQTTGGVGSATWESGTYTCGLNITTGHSDLSITNIYICRLDSSCNNLATVGSQSVSQTLTAGTYTFDVTGSEQSANDTDDLYVVYEFTNGHSHSTRTAGITPNQDIATPIEPDQAQFDVTIDSTNTPVSEGNTLDVDYTVTNNGNASDTQDVTLSIESPTNVIEDFETGTLDSGYQRDTTNYAVQDTTVIEGSWTLEGTGSGKIINPNSSHAIAKGNKFSWLTYCPNISNTNDTTMVFGWEQQGDEYYLTMDWSDDEARIRERNGGNDSFIGVATSVGWTGDTVYRVEVAWDDGTLDDGSGSDGDITHTTYEHATDTQMYSPVTTNSTANSGTGTGWYCATQDAARFDRLVVDNDLTI